MYKMHVRDLLEYEEDEMWGLRHDEEITITYDDGEVVTYPVATTILSWYHWKIAWFYPQIQLTSEFHIGDRDMVDATSHDIMIGLIRESRKIEGIDKEDVWFIMQRWVYNRLYNAMALRLTEYMSETGVKDILEIMDDPDVRAANDAIVDVPTLEFAYETLTNVFKTKKYPDNPMSKSADIRTVKLTSLLSSLSGSGKKTEIDSEIYTNIVRRGSAMGFSTLAQYAKESRSAAKAHLYNKDPVAIAEYFNMRLQFVSSVFTELVDGDCGTTDYHVFNIPTGKAGKKIIKAMEDLYQVHDDGSLSLIKADDESFLGKSVKFRTTLCCRLQSKQQICSVCYGDIAYAIPRHTNPGHVSCTSMNKPLTQLIISTKHLDFIIHNFFARLMRDEAAYFKTIDSMPHCIYLNTTRSTKNLVLRIYKDEAESLTAINYVSKVETLTLNNISSLTLVDMYEHDADGNVGEYHSFNMEKSATKASLSESMLRYLKKNGWTEDSSYYMIHLSKWDHKEPIFTYANKFESMAEFGNRVEKFIRSTKSSGTSKSKKAGAITMLTQYDDVTAALYDGYQLISDKLNDIYLGHIATMLAATRICDPREANFHTPDGVTGGEFATHDDIIRGRSLTVAFLYKDQRRIYDSIESYMNTDRASSILDDLLYIPPNKYHQTD